METKKCTKCGKVLPLSQFYKSNQTHDGYQCRCKECMSKAAKKTREKNKKMLEALNKTEKRCPHCGRVLPIDAFNRDCSKPDGRHSWCRECVKEREDKKALEKKLKEGMEQGKFRHMDKPFVREDADKIADTLFPEQEESSVAKSLKVAIEDDTKGETIATCFKDGKETRFNDLCEHDKKYLIYSILQVAIVMRKATM